ncbi:hypothetical protein CBF23_013710 [Marinomonas agarivorans]|nr:hypothetical protein CBF23_013710 [Marinomonas agarivorans]
MAYDRNIREEQEPQDEGFFSRLFNKDKTLYTIVIVALSVTISITLSTITTLILTPNSDQMLSQQAFDQSLERMTEIEIFLDEQIELSEKLDNNYEALQTHLRHSSSKALKNILLDQEQNFQAFLTVFQAAMRDLALELPDGLDWYNDYSTQMTRALNHSIQRAEVLSMLRVGEVEEKTPIVEDFDSEEDEQLIQ